MDYSESFMREHEEMCQMAGSIVFALAEAGRFTLQNHYRRAAQYDGVDGKM